MKLQITQKEVEEGLRLFDEALEKIGIIIPKETLIDNLVDGDTISKKALIQSFLADCECKDRSEAKAVTCSLDTMLELIDDAPPVEPPKKVVAQIKVDTDELVERIKEEYKITTQPVEDAISKKWLEDNAKEFSGYYQGTVYAVPLSILESAPRVIPERPKGEWINECENGHGFWVGTCDQCGKENHVNNFCPYCGADMR